VKFVKHLRTTTTTTSRCEVVVVNTEANDQ
jgi:hypothetical protein